MIRALSTRKVRGSYKKLGDEEEAGAGLLEVKPESVPTNPHGQSPKVNKPVEKTRGSAHPLFSFFDMSLKRKKKKKSTTTAKPEFARYLEYVKEGGVWDNTSNGPAIYYR
ncbi:hypothetical protein AtNW77_Chr5g0153661 [Arabidopsis thaliana]|uniref:Uncharacterized protein n=3 Tax=Arabidopsis TaxID=3701 RepID=Q8L8Y9_ARATH|nr:unknown [Arabidopsis thaliana]KAG7607531.1 hypothetical protein ISN45_At05g062980 [Arabidopsis thaliana x Arabidopsis arenosa]OAO95501.1 hypothetical protein AXX17_AT5G66440 [Arabidopsis thaliana]CAA0412461.1 unnamed protein product [Arabidopsis thaliana]CAD5336019.1 unnamed protein product [Arabidopsis thaliana]